MEKSDLIERVRRRAEAMILMHPAKGRMSVGPFSDRDGDWGYGQFAEEVLEALSSPSTQADVEREEQELACNCTELPHHSLCWQSSQPTPAEVTDASVADALQRLHNNLSAAPHDAVKCFVLLGDHRTILTAFSRRTADDEVTRLKAIMREVLPYLEQGYMEDEEDDEPIGWCADSDGSNQRPLPLTFGMVRRFRAALSSEHPVRTGEGA